MILYVFKFRCYACGLFSRRLEVDHIDGNTQNNNAFNLQPLCKKCHRIKTRSKSGRVRALTPTLSKSLNLINFYIFG